MRLSGMTSNAEYTQGLPQSDGRCRGARTMERIGRMSGPPVTENPYAGPIAGTRSDVGREGVESISITYFPDDERLTVFDWLVCVFLCGIGIIVGLKRVA